MSAAKLKHGTPFLGREALQAFKAAAREARTTQPTRRHGAPHGGAGAPAADTAQARPLRRRLLSFTVDAEPAAGVWGREGIYRDGERVGHITSGGVGFSVNAGRSIGAPARARRRERAQRPASA